MADATSAHKLYLFKGKHFLKIDPTTMQIEGGPSTLGDWSGLAVALNDGVALDNIDAVVYLPANAAHYPGTIMFFKADKYCIFDTQKNEVSASGRIADLLRKLPKGPDVDFSRDIDAAMMDTSSNLHLFKDSYNASASVTTLDFGNESRAVSAWTSLTPYSTGIDAATEFTPLRSDCYLFRDNSWTTPESRESQSIETLIPGLHNLGFDRGLDDILLAPFDKELPITSYRFMAPIDTSLTVLVLNNLSAQSNITVTVDDVATPALQVPAQRVWYNIYSSSTGRLSVDIADNYGTPMLLSASSMQIGKGTCHHIGAEKVPAGQPASGLYTDTIVVVSWPSKVV